MNTLLSGTMGKKSTYPGLFQKKGKIYIVFFWEGKQYHELPPSDNIWDARNCKKWAHFYKYTLKSLLKNKQFSWELFEQIFPHSKRVKQWKEEQKEEGIAIDGTMFFCEYLALYLMKTRDLYREEYFKDMLSMVKAHIIPAFEGCRICSIRKIDIEAKIASMKKKGLSSSSINFFIFLVKKVFREAHEEDGIISKNPAGMLKRVATSARIPEPFTTHELDIIFSYIKRFYPHYLNYFQFAVTTMMRPSEIAALDLEHVDFAKNTIFVEQTMRQHRLRKSTKTHSSRRVIDLIPQAKKILLEQQIMNQQSWNKFPERPKFFFLNRKGNPIDRANIFHRVWQPVFKKIKEAKEQDQHGTLIKYREPYQLRHTGASLAFMAGADLKWISRQLGHSVEKTTQIYRRFIPGEDRKREETMRLFSDRFHNIIP